MRHLLAATDGSESASRAVDFAAQLAKTFDAELYLVNVIQDLGLPHRELRGFMRAENVSLEEVLAAQADDILRKAKSRVLEIGALRVRAEAPTGDAVEAILDIARREGTDIIVVGRRGWGRVGGLLLGSVAQKLAG
jgi:nucleotide-binding universal stress UspA family protein